MLSDVMTCVKDLAWGRVYWAVDTAPYMKGREIMQPIQRTIRNDIRWVVSDVIEAQKGYKN